jgi:hypothetical protein
VGSEMCISDSNNTIEQSEAHSRICFLMTRCLFD